MLPHYNEFLAAYGKLPIRMAKKQMTEKLESYTLDSFSSENIEDTFENASKDITTKESLVFFIKKYCDWIIGNLDDTDLVDKVIVVRNTVSGFKAKNNLLKNKRYLTLYELMKECTETELKKVICLAWYGIKAEDLIKVTVEDVKSIYYYNDYPIVFPDYVQNILLTEIPDGSETVLSGKRYTGEAKNVTNVINEWFKRKIEMSYDKIQLNGLLERIYDLSSSYNSLYEYFKDDYSAYYYARLKK